MSHRKLAVVVACGISVVLAALLASGLEGKLRPTSLVIPGTESAQGEDLVDASFGDSAPFVVLLRGPAAALERQGPELVRRLREAPGASVVSPWDRGSVERLRPRPDRALILVDFGVGEADAVRRAVPELEATLAESIRPPVRATQTGFATLSRAIQEQSVDATRTAELLAIPILLLVLLFVFGSPVAAAIPLLLGAAAVLLSRAVLAIVAGHASIDGFALNVATMMGLALGVDYALLIVSRFREELAAGATPAEAAARTRRTSGRTVAFAGLTLAVAMVVILWAMPGTLFLSLAGTAILVTAISVLLAFFAAPPLLAALGPRVNRWRIGSEHGGTRLMAGVDAALRRPRLAAALTGGALLLLALPAVALKTGPPSAAQLPDSNRAREDSELISRAIGAGWDAPFVLVAAADRGPVTTEARLAALTRAQRRIAADPGVQAVIGPGPLERRVEPLQRGGEELISGRGETSPAKLARLGRDLDRAAGGVGQVRAGLRDAAAGAGLLALGSGRAGEGAIQLSDGLGQVAAGAGEAVDALDRLDAGSARIAEGQRRAALGSRAVKDEIAALLPTLRRGALPRARDLRAELSTAAAADPSLNRALERSELLVDLLATARNQAKRAHVLSSRLRAGQATLADGGRRLHRGAARIAAAAAPLPAGLARLRAGADALSGGLQRLTGGADALSRNLEAGSGQTQPLQNGLYRAGVRVSDSAADLDRQVGNLRRSSPGLFDSGYLVLAALQGAPPEQRKRAARVVDVEGGGGAARILVIPRFTFDTPGSAALYERLQGDAEQLTSASGLRTGVTGGPAQLEDYGDAVSSRVPLVIAAITLVTFLVLVVVLRALPLAALAVALNLLTVAVAFGVLTLLFEVPAGWPLGGRTYVDAIGAAGIFGIVFGLSIDYAVFLLGRMRESRERGASNEEAITHGLRRTARVITGAAAIMVAVFVAFAAAPIATVSQLGTGLAVAVVLDATVVRIVLLPALMLMIGERVWWLPRSLERLLPRAV